MPAFNRPTTSSMFRSWFASSCTAAAVADINSAAGNAFSRYVGNDDLNRVRVDGYIVVVIAAYTPRWLHHAGNFESGNRWFAHGKKQPLHFRSQFHVVALLLNRFDKRFPLLVLQEA